MELTEGSCTQMCYVVNDIEHAAREWSKTIGAGPWYLHVPAAENRVYRGQPTDDHFLMALAFSGVTSIELYQPLDDEPSIVREVLEKHGDGAFHHVWPNMSGLKGLEWEEKCKSYEALGLEVAMSCTFTGIGRAVFYDALDSIGGFIEVLELGDAFPLMNVLHEAHVGWDGSDPIRQLADVLAAA